VNTSSLIFRIKYIIVLILLSFTSCIGQDTFSIVAVDPKTGEVGSAGASCVDLTNFPNFATGFLGELFPEEGAINSQATYLSQNQTNARSRFNNGETPQEIIDWLVANDVQNQSQLRQYGIVRLVDGTPQSAAHTGVACLDYKNHITGPNYSIQGNILLGQGILDSMEARFLRAEGDLACKLMAAMEGANIIGADSRCTDNGTSSLFAFLKVAQPNDIFGNPALSLGVRLQNGQGIEPIDRLQDDFNIAHSCTSPVLQNVEFDNLFQVYPNPANDQMTIKSLNEEEYRYKILDLSGKILLQGNLSNEEILDLSKFTNGNYILELLRDQKYFSKIFSKT
jgi:uncharacterized Ntn-hydrolase superfamily protein